jgi:hypothetical protein
MALHLKFIVERKWTHAVVRAIGGSVCVNYWLLTFDYRDITQGKRWSIDLFF